MRPTLHPTTKAHPTVQKTTQSQLPLKVRRFSNSSPLPHTHRTPKMSTVKTVNRSRHLTYTISLPSQLTTSGVSRIMHSMKKVSFQSLPPNYSAHFLIEDDTEDPSEFSDVSTLSDTKRIP